MLCAAPMKTICRHKLQNMVALLNQKDPDDAGDDYVHEKAFNGVISK